MDDFKNTIAFQHLTAQWVSTTASIELKSGLYAINIVSHRDNIEFNLDHNFRRRYIFDRFLYGVVARPQRPPPDNFESKLLKRTHGYAVRYDVDNDMAQLLSSMTRTGGDYKELHDITEIPVEKPKVEIPVVRLFRLQKREFFSKSDFVWNIKIWNDLYTAMRELPDIPFVLSGPPVVLKHEDTFLLTSPKFELDLKTLNRLRILQAQTEKKEASKSSGPVPPSIDVTFILDPQTGILKLSVGSPGEYVRVHLDILFGESFAERFIAQPKTGEALAVESIDIVPQEPDQHRTVDLGAGERVGKSLPIWELAIWPQLVEALKVNRGEKFTIRYPVRVELLGVFDGVPLNDEGYSIVPYEEIAELTIDYRTMVQMEKRREASE